MTSPNSDVKIFDLKLRQVFQIGLAPMIKAKNRRIRPVLYNWMAKNVIIIDSVGGSGFVFDGFKRVLSFKEDLDWVIEKRISP